MRRCTDCKQDLPLEDFWKSRSRADGLQIYCKTCKRIRKKRWAITNPGKTREHTWKQRGIDMTWDRYQELLIEQNGQCAICFQECESGMALAVDHCHATGVTRGLLCRRCNQVLGKCDDDLVLLRRICEYLESHSSPLSIVAAA